jgi:hypothetical protein
MTAIVHARITAAYYLAFVPDLGRDLISDIDHMVARICWWPARPFTLYQEWCYRQPTEANIFAFLVTLFSGLLITNVIADDPTAPYNLCLLLSWFAGLAAIWIYHIDTTTWRIKRPHIILFRRKNYLVAYRLP